MDIKELQKIMQENGVVGAGGAGFPTYMKLTDKAEIILMNCAEFDKKQWVSAFTIAIFLQGE